jgi:hypothetical protein
LFAALPVSADSWSIWGRVFPANPLAGGAGSQLATDGTNLVYSTLADGVFRAPLDTKLFSALPMTGFPLADPVTNPTNGLVVSAVAATPQGTIVIAGSPVWVTTNSVTFNPPGGSSNTLPVFYWFDETNQIWQPSGITGHTYPYTGNVGNFSIAADGSLWTCSGYYPYAYRSTDGGKNFTAFDINARVPTNYIPIPINGISSFGEIFSICAGWNNEIVIGTETGGYLHSTNNGVTWRSLDPNFTSVTSTNPLSRTGDGRVLGRDKYGNFICANTLTIQSAAQTNWSNVKFIGWRPKDNSVFPATNGFNGFVGTGSIVTTLSGQSFIFEPQNYLLHGGVYRSSNGRDWTQFNAGTGLDTPFATNILTNAIIPLGPGNCITAWSNKVFIGVSQVIYSYDATVIPNRPPVGQPQNLNLYENSPTNLTLVAADTDGDAVNFTVFTQPKTGSISGTPPDLIYTPSNNYTGLDHFSFVCDDGKATSAPVFVNFFVNHATNTPSSVSLTSPANGQVFIAPATINLLAPASDPDGITQVFFYHENSDLGITNVLAPPYSITLSNVPAGDYVFSARAFDGKGARTWSTPVHVTVLPSVPVLNIQRGNDGNQTITWPSDLDGFFLESAPDLYSPWTLWPDAPFYLPNGQTVTVPPADQQFFRLIRP